MPIIKKRYGATMLSGVIGEFYATGPIEAKSLVLEILQSFAPGPMDGFKFTWTRDGGQPVDLCAVSDISNSLAGQMFALNGNKRAPLIKGADVSVLVGAQIDLQLSGPGTLSAVYLGQTPILVPGDVTECRLNCDKADDVFVS